MLTFLRILPYLVYGCLAVFAAVWTALFFGCLRKKHFWPILATDRATRVFWLCALLLLNPVLTVLYLLFGQVRAPDAPRGRDGALQVGLLAAVVALAGFLVDVPGLTHLWVVPLRGWGSECVGSSYRAFAATLEARNSTQQSKSSVTVDGSRVACRRVAIAHRGGDVFAARVARSLKDEIARIPCVEEIELCSDGRFLTSGELRPDLFVMLELRDVHVTPIPYAASMSAQVDVVAGTEPFQSSSHFADNTTGPDWELDLSMTVSHESRTLGFEKERYALSVQNIAEAIAGGLKSALDSSITELGLLPELPSEAIGEYRSFELPAALARMPHEEMGSFYGRFSHNESYWLLTTPAGDLREILTAVEAELTADGWKKASAGPQDLWMDKGTGRMHVFQPRHAQRAATQPEGPAESVARGQLCVRYVDRFSDGERRAVIDALFRAERQSDAWLLFSRSIPPARIVEIVEGTAWPSPAAFLAAIDAHLAQEHPEKAERMLRRARTALWAKSDTDDASGKLDSAAARIATALAKKSGSPKPAKASAPQIPTVEDFRAAGFRDLPQTGSPVEVEVRLDEPAAFFKVSSEEGPRVVAITLRRSLDSSPANAYRSSFIETTAGRKSWGESSGAWVDGGWRVFHSAAAGILVEAAATGSEDDPRFRVSVRRAESGE